MNDMNRSVLLSYVLPLQYYHPSFVTSGQQSSRSFVSWVSDTLDRHFTSIWSLPTRKAEMGQSEWWYQEVPGILIHSASSFALWDFSSFWFPRLSCGMSITSGCLCSVQQFWFVGDVVVLGCCVFYVLLPLIIQLGNIFLSLPICKPCIISQLKYSVVIGWTMSWLCDE